MECPSGIASPCPVTNVGASSQFFLTLINALFVSHCNLSPERNNIYPGDQSIFLTDNEDFDFIVVGAGSAGSIVASRLSENPDWRVLLIEAGGIPSTLTEIPSLYQSAEKTHEDWQYMTEPSSYAGLSLNQQRINWPRGKTLGGSGAINGMLYVRGSRNDYDEWADLGNRNWDYNSLVKYFEKVENLQGEPEGYFGRSGKVFLTRYQTEPHLRDGLKRASEELGYVFENHEKLAGFFDIPVNIQKGVRYSPFKAYLTNLMRKNLVIAMNSHVTKIFTDETNKFVAGVDVRIGERILRFNAKREVILSGGAINSPQLLMVSGIGPRDDLERLGIDVIHDLPAVGANLQDHICYIGLMVKFADEVVPEKIIINELFDYFMHRKGILATVDLNNFVGFMNTKNASDYPNMEFHHIFFPKNDNYLLPLLLDNINVEESLKKFEIEQNKRYGFLKICPTLLKPKSIGRILLRSSDPFEKPLIYPEYLTNEEDIETLYEAIMFVQRLLRTESLSKYRPQLIRREDISNCNHLEYDTKDYWYCSIRNLVTTIYHPIGTCRMGSNVSSSVVDDRLRVHGIENLRVIDASVMPTIPGANTNAATMMIGEKGADLIIETWTPKHDQKRSDEF